MKILELTRSFYPSIGGMEKFVSDRMQIYNYLGIKHQVITTNHSEKQIAENNKLPGVLYLESYTPYEIIPKLNSVLSALEYDILSINQLNYFYSFQAVETAKRLGKRIILTPHLFFHTNRFKIFKDFHNNYVVAKILKSVQHIICFTEYEASYWIANFPFIKEKITIIPHYFKEPRIKPSKKKNNLGKFIFYLGRSERNKRIDLLIRAFAQIKTNYNLVLTIDYDEITKRLQNIVKSDNRIHLLGRISEQEKQSLLSQCSALILPSSSEAFGIVNLEASFYEKPLLLSKLSVFSSFLNDKGILYFENNVNSVKDVLNRFLNLSDKDKIEMGRINFSNLKNFTFEKILDKYKKLL